MPPANNNHKHIEEFLRKSLLGEELTNTQFHLFSTRSTLSGRVQVVKPRVLCANNILLSKGSKYFLDLLGSDINPSDPSLSDLLDDNDVPSSVPIDQYGYASDSDLEDEDEDEEPPIPIAGAESEALKDHSMVGSMSPPQIGMTAPLKDDTEISKDRSESVISDIVAMSPEHSRTDELFVSNTDGAKSVARTETVNQQVDMRLANPSSTALRLRSLGSRHVLVKDAAFRTWYTLLNYLYTGKFMSSPLSSSASGGQPCASSTSALDQPTCSAKSMYRLACKVGLDHLRNEALSQVQRSLSEHNILKELSCSLVSRYPELLEMELDVLYTHIGSPPVVAGFPTLAHQIAVREVPHGADVIIGIHARVLREHQPLPQPTTTPACSSTQSVLHSGGHPSTQATFGSSDPCKVSPTQSEKLVENEAFADRKGKGEGTNKNKKRKY